MGMYLSNYRQFPCFKSVKVI